MYSHERSASHGVWTHRNWARICCKYRPPLWRMAYGLQLGWWGSWSHDDDGRSRLSWRCQLSAYACVQGVLWMPYIRSQDCSCNSIYTSLKAISIFNKIYNVVPSEKVCTSHFLSLCDAAVAATYSILLSSHFWLFRTVTTPIQPRPIDLRSSESNYCWSFNPLSWKPVSGTRLLTAVRDNHSLPPFATNTIRL
jgi:hypothetical protein